MANILIRNVPDDILRLAKAQAEKHHRSLQQELSEVLAVTIRFRAGGWAREADTIRRRLSRKGKLQSDSAELQREDRDR